MILVSTCSGSFNNINDEVGISNIVKCIDDDSLGSIYLHEMYLFCMAIVWKSLFLVDPTRWALVWYYIHSSTYKSTTSMYYLCLWYVRLFVEMFSLN